MLEILLSELKRLWPVFFIALATVICLGEYAQFAVQLYRLSMVAMVVAAAHLIRKALFPYIDLEIFAKTAGLSPIGAGLVYMGVLLLLTVIIAIAVVPY